MSDTHKKLAIIIVEYNTPTDTLRCLETIEKYLSSCCKIYIYDNSDKSSTGLIDRLDSLHIDCEYIRNSDNFGFSKACNLGLLKAKADGYAYAMLLNNDTLLVDESPLMALNSFHKHPELGILGLVNYYSHDSEVIWQAGKDFRSSKLGFVPVSKSQDSDITFCDYVPGSSLIIKLSIIESVGFLDESYFAYYEEIDYCLRAKNEGFVVAYSNNSRILHAVGSSSSGKIKAYLKTRNKLYFYRKILASRCSFLVVVGLLLVKDFLLQLVRRDGLKNIRYMCLGVKDFNEDRMEFKRFSGQNE